MHHPLSYLHDWNEGDIRNILKKKCDIVLHGHLHVSEFDKIIGMRNETVVIPSGSLYQGRSLVNSYNLATVDLEHRNLTIRYRRYSDMQQAFVKDIDTTGEELDGVLQRRLENARG
jgi:predicted phosphodiesterase